MQNSSIRGWQCPVCGRVMAPWISVCVGQHDKPVVTASGTSPVRCGECSVYHNNATGCPMIGGCIPPSNTYSCGYGVSVKQSI